MQSCSSRDWGLGLETARDWFFAVLVLVSPLPLVLASVSKCRFWTSFQDHSCICQTISFGCLFLPVTQVTKFLTSLSHDLLFFMTIFTSLRYSNFSCVIFYGDCFWWSWSWSWRCWSWSRSWYRHCWSWSWSWNSGLDYNYKTGWMVAVVHTATSDFY